MKNEGAAWQSRSSDEGLISLDNATLDFLDARDDEEPIPDEVRWREPNATRGFARCDVRVSRWSASSGVEHEHESKTPSQRHIVSLALSVSKLRLSTRSAIIFDGLIPSGTIYISVPGQQLTARFTPPFDFLHFHVENSFLREEGIPLEAGAFSHRGETQLFRDPLMEALGRSLIDSEGGCHPQYIASIGRAIATRTMMRSPNQKGCCKMPKWRLRRLEEYLATNIERSISLQDMASVVGLSRMHFAAQFRAATGFRPHEYLLMKRIEQAKIVMSETSLPLIEVAFSVGFSAQAHFSTVFKRFTGKSPAQWKQGIRCTN